MGHGYQNSLKMIQFNIIGLPKSMRHFLRPVGVRGSVLYQTPALCTRHREETFGYNCTPGRKPSYLCPVGP